MWKFNQANVMGKKTWMTNGFNALISIGSQMKEMNYFDLTIENRKKNIDLIYKV